MSYQKNVTYINELPDLDDLENKMTDIDRENVIDKKRYIRNFSNPQYQYGINSSDNRHMNYYTSPSTQQTEFFTPTTLQQAPIVQDNPNSSVVPACLDVHGHIVQCPICSKFFKFDATIYIIIIVLLTIICILLLKKVMSL